MRKILLGLALLILMAGNANATVGWNKSIPATSENPQAISPDVIENNTATDLMLQNYRDGNVYVKLISTSEIDIGPGGVMLSNSGGSTRLMVANASLTAMSSTNIDTGSISPSSTYYIYAYASSTTATTFSVIYSASSTSPTGITYYQQIGKFTTDGSSNFVTSSSNVNYQVGVGTPTAISAGTIYLASVDTIVTATFYDNNHTGTTLTLYSDSSSNPSTPIAEVRSAAEGTVAPITWVVKKGLYYEFVLGGSGGIISFAYSENIGQ